MKLCALALLIFYGCFRSESFIPKVLHRFDHSWNYFICHYGSTFRQKRSSYSALTSVRQKSEFNARDSLITGDVPPSPLDKIVDVNIERNSIVYEIFLNREHGFDLTQGLETPVVGRVQPGSLAASLGVQRGDLVVATSATVGGQMWYHDTVESVKSALSTRFVLNNNVIIRFERKISQIPEHLLSHLKVPYYYYVRLRRPLGLHIKENDQKEVIVEKLVSGLNAERSSLIKVGDQIISISATWGDKLWDVKSVESFIVAVNMRSDSYMTLKLKRMIPLSSSLERLMQGKSLVMDFFLLCEEEDGRKVNYRNSTRYQSQQSAVEIPVNRPAESTEPEITQPIPSLSEEIVPKDQIKEKREQSSLLYYDTVEYLKFVKTIDELIRFWNYLQDNSASPTSDKPDNSLRVENKLTNQTFVFSIVNKAKLDTFAINKLMSKALELNDVRLAIEIFEKAFYYDYSSLMLDIQQGKIASTLPPPTRLNPLGKRRRKPEDDIYKVLQSIEEVENDAKVTWKWVKQEEEANRLNLVVQPKERIDLRKLSCSDPNDPSVTIRECLIPNNFILPTIMKAYGRNYQLQSLEYLIPWMETYYNRTADIYSFSSLLYAYAKFKCQGACEYVFYQEIPRRNLTINTVTINSFMYLYTKLNRPMDALKLYDLIKSNMKNNDRGNRAITYNQYTFSILIKSLLISNNPRLHSIVFEIIDSLPSIGIYPTIDLYNQLFEYYASVLNYRRIREVIKRIADYNRYLRGIYPKLDSSSREGDFDPLLSLENGSYSFPNSTEEGGQEREEESRSAIPLPSSFMINRPQKVELNLRSYSHIIFCYSTGKLPRSALMMYSVMRRQGFSPDKYIYMSILKALYWLKDYLSSIQVIEEMVAKGRVMPDAMHYGQAIQTCLIANKAELAEELIKFYLVQNSTTVLTSSITGSFLPDRFSRKYPLQQERRKSTAATAAESSFRTVPPLLCNLWLQSLLQQSKWKEAMILFRRMNEDHVTKMKRIAKAFSSKTPDQPQLFLYDDLYIGSPNREALEVLLKYQILSEKYEDALKTVNQLSLLALTNPKHGWRLQNFSVARILSLALGPYASSSSLLSYEQTRPSDNENLLMFSSYDDSLKVYSKYSNSSENDPYSALFGQENDSMGDPNLKISNEKKRKSSKRKEGSVSRSGKRKSSDSQEAVNGDLEDSLKSEEEPINLEENVYSLEDRSVNTSPSKNMPLALKFLLKVFKKMADYPNLQIQSDLYCDFIKAVLVEQQFSLAQEILNLRQSNKIHLKITNENQLKTTEEFLFQSLQSTAAVSSTKDKEDSLLTKVPTRSL